MSSFFFFHRRIFDLFGGVGRILGIVKSVFVIQLSSCLNWPFPPPPRFFVFRFFPSFRIPLPDSQTHTTIHTRYSLFKLYTSQPDIHTLFIYIYTFGHIYGLLLVHFPTRAYTHSFFFSLWTYIVIHCRTLIILWEFGFFNN